MQKAAALPFRACNNCAAGAIMPDAAQAPRARARTGLEIAPVAQPVETRLDAVKTAMSLPRLIVWILTRPMLAVQHIKDDPRISLNER